jgi:hypothetical protein
VICFSAAVTSGVTNGPLLVVPLDVDVEALDDAPLDELVSLLLESLLLPHAATATAASTHASAAANPLALLMSSP